MALLTAIWSYFFYANIASLFDWFFWILAAG